MAKMFLPSLLLFGLAITAFSAGDDQFVFSGFKNSGLTLDGSAVITQGGLLDMSNGTNNVKGHAIYPTPLLLRNSSSGKVQSFSATIVFCIVGVYPGVNANGMAFFIAPSKNLSEALPTQYFGILKQEHNNNLLVVEIDTFQNPELQDINDNHIGIDISSVFPFQSYMAGFYEDSSGDFKNLTLNNGMKMQLWVEYEQELTRINVTLAPLHVGKPLKPLLSATYDLVRTGKASPQTDMYAFGMFLLEVACGQKPIKQNTEGKQIFLVDWVIENWNNRSLSKTVDIWLRGDYNTDEACLVLKIGLLCLHPFPCSRSCMRDVMQYFNGEIPLPELRTTQLSMDMQGLMQDNGFNTCVMSYPQLMPSFSAMSDLSGGR